MNSLSLSHNGSHSQYTSNAYTGYKATISTTEDLVKKAMSLFKLELFSRVLASNQSETQI